jgi:hypothetical protein
MEDTRTYTRLGVWLSGRTYAQNAICKEQSKDGIKKAISFTMTSKK